MAVGIGVGDVAGHLARVLVPPAPAREVYRLIIAGLGVEGSVVNARRINARRGPGLEPPDPQRHGAQPLRQGDRRAIAGAATAAVVIADMDRAPQERPHREDHGGGPQLEPHAGHHAADLVMLDDQVMDRVLEQRQGGHLVEETAHGLAIETAVGLGAGCLHGGTLALVEGAELDAGAIRGAAHDPAHGVDLTHQMALADPANGRVAAHLTDTLEALGEQQGARAHARRRMGRLGAGMAAAHDDDVIPLIELHSRIHPVIYRYRRSRRSGPAGPRWSLPR